jgi:hypothetical protein
LVSEPEAAMAFREVRVFEVREVLRLWLAGEGIRATERLVGFDRKTVRRYVDAAVGLGLVRDGGETQLTDVFIGLVVEAVRPHRTDGHGEAWRLLQAHHDEITAWVEGDAMVSARTHRASTLQMHGDVVTHTRIGGTS